MQTTGIWKTVWLEYAPESRIASLKLTPQLAEKAVRVEAAVEAAACGDLYVLATASFEGVTAGRALAKVTDGRADILARVANREISEWGVRAWTPEALNLYDLEVQLLRGTEAVDTVLSYFGMREIRIQGNQVCLNGAVLYQRLILDQGYWRDSHLTPPERGGAPRGHREGHGARLQRRAQAPENRGRALLYWCDVKGLLVWSEFRRPMCSTTTRWRTSRASGRRSSARITTTPRSSTWTPFNESWGIPDVASDKRQQRFIEAIYSLTKAIDPMRPVVCNDGWRYTVSDIITPARLRGERRNALRLLHEKHAAVLENALPFSVNGQFYPFAEGLRLPRAADPHQ